MAVQQMDSKIGIFLTEIRMRRKDMGLTQAEAAKKCGMRQANYSRMESGKQLPSLETLLEVADALKLRLVLQPADFTVYHIMWENEPVADVELSYDHRQIRYQKWVPDGLKQPFSGTDLTLERFYRFLKSRCYEDHRGDLHKILEKAHLSDNDPYNWVSISHGVTYDDFFWIRINDEKKTWEEVKIR